MIRNHEHILLVRINDIDALVSWEKLLFSTNFIIKVYLSIGINTDSHNNLLSYNDWAPHTHFPYWDKGINALAS